MSLDHDKIAYIASQLALKPDQRRGVHTFLTPYVKDTAPAAPAISAAESRRLARLDAAIAAGSAELHNLQLELKRLGVKADRAVDLAELRRVADAYGFSAEKKIQLIAACANVGLID
jgi:NADH:ubiquinone oxidoreductase subunit E